MIDFISNYIAPIFYEILYMSIIGSLIGAIILISRKVLDKKISPKWKCIIWVILIISLLIPIKFEIENKNIETLSISGIVEPIKDTSYKNQYKEIQDKFENISQQKDTNDIRNGSSRVRRTSK